MKQSFKTGLGFGLTSGVITTLGLIVGLNAGTHSKTAVVAGILVIAIADALSDALGIHIAEETNKNRSKKEIWEATGSTFVFKFVTALTFVVPVLLLALSTAVIAGAAWGLFLIGIFSFYLARQQKKSPFRAILEHIFIAVLVIIATYFIGRWVGELV
ncbi:hypothetical protein L6259_03420 [Candidatus Parcubacteria bacterium]|nr:hypothetical protein [Patescibacteria group bacterium]MCG2694286.1 hypothetical protein [Candidatus Parcubacteria bacterium]